MGTMKFKVGDKVRCLRVPRHFVSNLIEGQTYEVSEVDHADTLKVQGSELWYGVTRFKLVEPAPVMKSLAELRDYGTTTFVGDTRGVSLEDFIKPLPLTGGSSDYYKFPEGAREIMDLIEHKNMSFALGNIFKAVYRLGDKPGVTQMYDLEKIIYFAEREITRLNRE